MSKFTLADLEKRVHERAKASAAESYTRTLIDKGVAHCAKKLGEEAIETGLAAVQEDKGRLIAEAADLLYHLLVLLKRVVSHWPRWKRRSTSVRRKAVMRKKPHVRAGDLR